MSHAGMSACLASGALGSTRAALSICFMQEVDVVHAEHARVCCRQLDCKVEEIHTTLRKHLAKEEGQLLPLLLEHFTHAEQVWLSFRS